MPRQASLILSSGSQYVLPHPNSRLLQLSVVSPDGVPYLLLSMSEISSLFLPTYPHRSTLFSSIPTPNSLLPSRFQEELDDMDLLAWLESARSLELYQCWRQCDSLSIVVRDAGMR